MSFEQTNILKFSETISKETHIQYKNLEQFDNKIIFVRRVPQNSYKKKVPISDIELFFEKIKDYEVIIFDDCEHIWIDSWIELLIMLNNADKTIILTTFSIGIRYYLDKVIPNNKIHYNSIEKLFCNHLQPYSSLLKKSMDFSNKRKYLLKFFSYNRSPHRDYVFDFLLKNKLIEGNNVSFHNYPFEELSDKLDLKNASQTYCFDEVEDLIKDIDFKTLNNLRIIPSSESFNLQEQKEQTKKNFDASSNSYFEIISEAQMPLSKDPLNSLYYTYSITRRTLTPILFGSVFHIMPDSKLFEDELTNAGFQLFFKDNDDFLNNLNEEFYFKAETQSKINHNYNLLNKILDNHIEFEMFILKKIEQIYSIKFEI
jgi:hypothetical protein